MRPPPSATVGVLGCSNTQDAATGYHAYTTAGTLWSARDLQGYGGKCLVDWTDPLAGTWKVFKQGLAKYTLTDRIWWQLCTHINEGTAQSHANAALAILRGITSLPVIASPIDISATCGRSDEVLSGVMVDTLVDAGEVMRGPILSPLAPNQMKDACHANAIGALVWGQELSEFFD